ncbi:hypothetical protein [uncultured Gemmiger sp.]|uniref:hypothetical protein n=1 Tax=uncultured Gemmiger sp. TaxID=1623490 RepID=UPI0025F9E66C|nr:hypothetical protein [uncultured Gemmiger sp.]
MKRKVIALFLCIVLVCTFSFPAYADSDDSSSDGYSAIISDIPTTCPTCGAALHASWRSTAGAEVELQITEAGKITIPAGAGVYAHFRLYCENCGYSKSETRILGLDWGSEHPGQWEVKQVPSGIGRKDLPGYVDDNGTATYNSNGELQVTVYPRLSFTSSADLQNYPASIRANHSYAVWTIDGLKVTGRSTYSGATDDCNVYFDYFLSAPVSGTYYIATQQEYIKNQYSSSSGKFVNRSLSAGGYSFYLRKGATNSFNGSKIKFSCNNMGHANSTVTSYFCPIILTVIPDTTTINQQTNITINNNTWNGNIYTDNSTNLTYIYPQYTTINEKNETVTNISTTPIIYNNETKQYYTYDQTTKNYYYINYEAAPTPTPAPTETPTPSPEPTEEPSPSPTPTPGGSGTGGGDVSTPETGKPGGSSGSSWWDKLLSKIGDAIIDGLLGAISAVLKLIFKLLSTILGWIIWLVSQVLTLFPFLPPGLGALLIGGVVVCFVIGIIKFIRG